MYDAFTVKDKVHTRRRQTEGARASLEGGAYLLVDGDFEQHVILERLSAKDQAVVVLGEVARGGAIVVGEGDTMAASPVKHVVYRVVAPCCRGTIDVQHAATHRHPPPPTVASCTRSSISPCCVRPLVPAAPIALSVFENVVAGRV